MFSTVRHNTPQLEHTRRSIRAVLLTENREGEEQESQAKINISVLLVHPIDHKAKFFVLLNV